MHLVAIHKEVERVNPSVVILDPISNFVVSGDPRDVNSMLTRLIDFLKGRTITAFLTSLTEGGKPSEATTTAVSSIIDVWLLVRDIELSGERNRGLYVLKARGMSHSNQIREFLLSSDGIQLVEVYLGSAGMLTGSARAAQEAIERDAALRPKDEKERRLAALERKRQVMEARIATLRAEFEADETETHQALVVQAEEERRILADRSEMSRSRKANGTVSRRDE
jgi:circadian clock protein KaiC